MMNKFEIICSIVEFANIEFIRLKNMYNLDDSVTFNVPMIREYMANEYDNRYKHNCDCVQSVMTEIVNDYLLEESFIFTKYDEYDGKVFYRIVLPKYHISEVLFGSSIELVKKYITVILMHEIGHVLHVKDIIARYGDKAEEYLINEDQEFFEKWSESIKPYEEDDSITEAEYQRICISNYYKFGAEIEANRLAGVNVNDLIDLELKVRLGYE